METILKNKRILITGGAGSVGGRLAEVILKYDPKTIRIYDMSENEVFKLKTKFAEENKTQNRVRYLIGDVRDLDRLSLAMENIDYVFHLAAMKHVYACEYNPFEAVKTNISGLQNIIDSARNADVEKVIFTSTDKAASPSSVMGMTKLLGEKLISQANYYKGDKRTVFSSVRFGNVIGSNGSVVPLFKKQIFSGGPLTITEKEMTRFVITMDEAIELIFSALRLAKGGETFIWKMRTLKVTDLADAIIKKHGSGQKIEVDIIGKGEAEKLHEEIMSEEELLRSVEMAGLYVVFPIIDHGGVKSSHKDVMSIQNPVVISDQGTHLSVKDIEKLLEGMEI